MAVAPDTIAVLTGRGIATLAVLEDMAKKYKTDLNNELFWLNVQLSTTKSYKGSSRS